MMQRQRVGVSRQRPELRCLSYSDPHQVAAGTGGALTLTSERARHLAILCRLLVLSDYAIQI